MEQDTAKNLAEKTGRYVLVFAIACVCFAAVLVSVNYFTDRYYIFHGRDGEFLEFLEPNSRVLKARYLKDHCNEFDAIIMGSSRDVGYLSRDVNQSFGVTTYNYGVAAGNLRGIQARLEWLASKNCLPARIFIPISIDKLRLPERPDDLLRKEHPDIVGTREYHREFLLSYIGTDAFISNVRKLLRGKEEPKFRYDMATGDVHYLWDRSFEIEECDAMPDAPGNEIFRQYRDYLVAIKGVAEQNNARVTLLWNPQPINIQVAHVDQAKELFSVLSGEFRSIYRLPLSDERLRDSSYYHDKGHFKPELGAAVIASPDHLVPLRTLVSELEGAAAVCRQQ